MSTYADQLSSRLPTYLRDAPSLLFAGKVGAAMDLCLQALKDAVRVGLVYLCTDDALAAHLADVAMEGLPGETAASQRARVAAAFDTWTMAGTRPGLVLAVEQLGFSGYALRTSRDWLPDAPPDGNASLWARWWLLLPTHPWSTDGVWSDPGTWGDGGTWDSTATVAEVARVKRLLRAQSNARELGYVRLYFGSDGDIWGPETPWDHGVWGAATITFIDWIVE